MACLSNCNADASCGGFWLEIAGSETATGSESTSAPAPKDTTTAPKDVDPFCLEFPEFQGCRRKKRQAGKTREKLEKHTQK